MTSPVRPSLSLRQFTIGLFHGLAENGYTSIVKTDFGCSHVAASQAYLRIHHQFKDFITLGFDLVTDPVFHEARGWNEVLDKLTKSKLLEPYPPMNKVAFNKELLVEERRKIPEAPEVWREAIDAFVEAQKSMSFKFLL